MLSMISSDTADGGTRMAHNQLAAAACLSGCVDAAGEFRGGSVVFARPRHITGAYVAGRSLEMAGLLLPQGRPSVRKQYISKTHLNKARNAAATGGVPGPHPARDPV